MSVSSEGTFDACFTENASEEVIKVKSASEVLSPIFKKHETNRIFLKLDCEGAEFKSTSQTRIGWTVASMSRVGDRVAQSVAR